MADSIFYSPGPHFLEYLNNSISLSISDAANHLEILNARTRSIQNIPHTFMHIHRIKPTNKIARQLISSHYVNNASVINRNLIKYEGAKK